MAADLLKNRVRKAQTRNVEPREYLVIISGRGIHFEYEGATGKKGVYRTMMVIDESTMKNPSFDDFATYRAAMTVSLLRGLPKARN